MNARCSDVYQYKGGRNPRQVHQKQILIVTVHNSIRVSQPFSPFDEAAVSTKCSCGSDVLLCLLLDLQMKQD